MKPPIANDTALDVMTDTRLSTQCFPTTPHPETVLGRVKFGEIPRPEIQHPNSDGLKTIARKLHLSGHWLLLGEGDPEGQAQPTTPPIEHPVDPFVTRLQEVIRSLHEAEAPNEMIREAIFTFLRNPQPPPPPTAPAAAAAIPEFLKTGSDG